MLDIGSCGIGDDGAKHLAGTALPALHTLNLRRSSLTERGLHYLADAKDLRTLRRLDLSMNAVGSAGLAALCASAMVPMLDGLDLRGAQLADADADADADAAILAGPPLAARLVVLDLGANKITEVGAASLAAAAWPKLRSLSLSGNPLDQATETLRAALPHVRLVLRSTTTTTG